MSVKQTEEKITALYERLSRDDDLMGESNSIPRSISSGYSAFSAVTPWVNTSATAG